jgi:hypothetical protein
MGKILYQNFERCQHEIIMKQTSTGFQAFTLNKSVYLTKTWTETI